MNLRRVKIWGLLALLFFHFYGVFGETAGDSLEIKIQSAVDEQRIVNDLGNGFYQNPTGEFLLAPKTGDIKYAILIYNIDILPDKAVFSAGMAFREPFGNQLVAFRANQVVFSYTHGLTGPATLFLIDSLNFKLGKAITFTFLGGTSEDTYAKFECSGFKEFGLHGRATFNNNYLQPVNDTGQVIQNKSLQAGFHAKASKWNDILVEMNLPQFQVKSAPGFIFSTKKVLMDLSESYNSPGFYLPKAYTTRNLLPETKELWEGFYIENAEITLPKFFKNESQKPITFGISNTIIDEFGFTGNIFVQQILSFEKGNLAGWNFSIDELAVQIELNSLKSGTIKGDLGLPVLPDTSKLAYYCRFDHDEHYLFSIKTKGDLSIPALKAAKLELEKNSFVIAEIDHGKIALNAELHGKFVVQNAAKEKSKYRIPEVVFRGMHIGNKAPKFGVEYLGISRKVDSSNFNAFPIQITELAFSGKGENFLLHTAFQLHLTEYASAQAGLNLYCKYININGRDKFVFDKYGIDNIAFQFEKSGMLISGNAAIFNEDITYGNGFTGNIGFQLRDPSLKASARALFGKIGSIRYWYFDAETMWPAPGIPLFPGANINGFVGGAWHRLKPWDGSTQNLHPEYGRVASGTVFIPSADAGLGLKAGAYLNGGTEKSYLAKTVLELQFLKTGALSKTMFYGDLQIMPKSGPVTSSDLIKSSQELPASNAWKNYTQSYKPSAEISGPFMLEYDFTNKSFYANSALYIYHAAGNTINGSQTNGLAGTFSAHFSQNKWFVRVGEPQKPIAVKLAMSKLASVDASAYINAGNELLKPATLPSEIIQFMGYNPTPKSVDQTENIKEGKGLAMGMRLQALASAGGSDKKFSIYASLKAIAGFDVALQKFDKIICSQTQNPMGQNDWYSNGKLYAFVQGKVGAKAGRIAVDVLTITGALDMTLGTPNPTFASGKTKIEFNVGGVFKYNGNLNIQLGEACDPGIQLVGDTSIVLKTNPTSKSTAVDPFNEIHAEFSLPVNTKMELPNGKFIEFHIRNMNLISGGKIVSGNWSYSNNNQFVTLVRSTPLEPLKKYTFNIEIEAVEIIGGIKKPLYTNGKPLEEIHHIDFETGKFPNQIPISNVLAAYPYSGQVNFYKNQIKVGYINLKYPQDYLFNKPATKTIARFTDKNYNNVAEVAVVYASGKLNFSIPSVLQANEIYHLRIVQITTTSAPAAPSSGIGIGSAASRASSALSGSGTTASGISTSSAGTAQSLLLSYHFRCSYYNTFGDKIKNSVVSNVQLQPNNSIVFEMNNAYGETFEPNEIENKNTALVKTNSLPLQTIWYKQEGLNKTYSIFKTIPSGFLLTRDTQELGFPAVKTVQLNQQNIGTITLGSNQILYGKPVNFGTNSIAVNYNLGMIVQEDLSDIKSRINSYPLINTPTFQTAVLNYKNLFLKSTPSSAASSSATLPMPSGISMSSKTSGLLMASGTSSIASPIPISIQNIKIPNLYSPGSYPIQFTYFLTNGAQSESTILNIALK
ncbi:MAG: hypothetical protein IT244_03240 [Bacteroidia bacterium]|nr:hypothetical protein [Bacteroidia bacterium]